MKSGVVKVEIVYLKTSYLCFWDWTWFCTFWVIYLLYIVKVTKDDDFKKQIKR